MVKARVVQISETLCVWKQKFPIFTLKTITFHINFSLECSKQIITKMTSFKISVLGLALDGTKPELKQYFVLLELTKIYRKFLCFRSFIPLQSKRTTIYSRNMEL